MTPDSLMKRVSSLVQIGQLSREALAAMSLIVGRWLAACPIPVAELDRYLPLSPRGRRRLISTLREHKLVTSIISPNRNTLLLPLCVQLQQPLKPEPKPEPVPVPQPTPPEPTTAKEPYVPIKPPEAWHDILPPEQPHAVRKSVAGPVSKLLANYKPADIAEPIVEKVKAAKYPMAYLATLCTPAGEPQPHVRPGATKQPRSKPQPQPKATTTTAMQTASVSEPQEKPCPSPATAEQIAAAFGQFRASLEPKPQPSPWTSRRQRQQSGRSLDT